MSFTKTISRKIRAANSLLMTLTAIPVAASSVYLYFAPYDAAYRNVWDNLHTFLGFVLIGSFLLHIPMNWRPIRSYIRKKTAGFARPRAEGFVALTVFALLMLGGIAYPIYVKSVPASNTAANVAGRPAVDPEAVASAGVETPAAESAVQTGATTTQSRVTYVPADISGCGNCDLLQESGCHSGMTFDLKGTIYYGSASGVSYVQKVVEVAVAADAAGDSDSWADTIAAAVPEGIDASAATEPSADTQVAYAVEGSGKHGSRNQ